MTAAVDPAVLDARRVVGLYGDPAVSWSIVLALTFARPLERTTLDEAARVLAVAHPHLGRAPIIETLDDTTLARFADRPYDDQDPLLRVALGADGHELVVAAHHGAVDGLGLLGAASALAGVPLTSSARGIDRTAEPTGFLRAGAGRVIEALTRPPRRLASEPQQGAGDWLTSRPVAAARTGSGALVAASAVAVRRWNEKARTRPPGRRLVVAMGLSRRPGTPTPEPIRDTAYVRLPAERVATAADGAALVAATLPEPAFPVSDGNGPVARLVRVLGNRLGSTLLVSNLGLIDGSDLVEVRFWPVPGGPAGTAVGLVTAAGTTTVSVRLRRNAFTRSDAEAFGELVAAELERLGQ